DAEEDDEEEPTREELVENILDLIRSTVGTPLEWEDGAESSVRELNGSLFVKTSASNHRDILGVLSQFRERRATQISVEARFLLVDNNFLEEFGLDLDFRYKGGGKFGPIAVDQNTINTASITTLDTRRRC
ncbi:MAG: hypothetical protein HC828_10885, partial [Blastochloris sp.]|nr:hypothetical protein [Blastochloris sp.]